LKGVSASLSNALDLIDEGIILLEGKKFARAYTLFQFATEEIGKSRLLFSLLISIKSGEEINWNKFNKEFVTHTDKTKGAIVFDHIAILLLSNYNLDDEKKIAEYKEYNHTLVKEENNVKASNDNKNNSLYVGIKDGKITSPKELITEVMATTLKENAQRRYIFSLKLFDLLLNTDFDRLVKDIIEFKKNPPADLYKRGRVLL